MEGSYKFSGVDETVRVEPVPPADDIDPGVLLKLVLKALEEMQYPGLVQLHVWHFPLKENIDASAGSLVRAPPTHGMHMCSDYVYSIHHGMQINMYIYVV